MKRLIYIYYNTATCLLLKTVYMRARRLRKATVQRARSCTRMHTHSYEHTVFTRTRVPARTLPKISPSLPLGQEKEDQQQLQQEQAVGGQQRASLSHAADSSSRRQSGESERRSERERRSVSALYRPFDDGASTASAGYRLARAAVKKAADRRTKALRSRAHTQSRHSVDYRRAACCEIGLLRSSLVATPI